MDIQQRAITEKNHQQILEEQRSKKGPRNAYKKIHDLGRREEAQRGRRSWNNIQNNHRVGRQKKTDYQTRERRNSGRTRIERGAKLQEIASQMQKVTLLLERMVQGRNDL